MRVLYRLRHWTESGIEYESDQMHAESIVAELGLGSGSRGATTPGIALKSRVSEEDEPLLEWEQRSRRRGIVARPNYLARDKCDIK